MSQLIRMRAANGKGAELKQFQEVYLPKYDVFDPIQGIKHAKEFQYRRGDIIQCSYIKCGLHWMNNMLWKLYTPDDSAKPRDTVLEIELQGALDSLEDPRIIPSHFTPSRLYPSHMENKGKVVLMLRNPKDVAVSYYHFLKNSSVFKNQQTWDEFFQSFIQGELMGGSYFTYLREWEQVLQDVMEGKSKLDIEVFYYENFLLKPEKNIARLNKFLDFGRDEQYLNRVITETTFAALKTRYESNSKTLANRNCIDKEGNSVIFRKGQIGDWKNHLTIAQSEMMDQMLSNALRHDIIMFRFEL